MMNANPNDYLPKKIQWLISEAGRINDMPQVNSEELVSKIEEFFKKSIEVYIGLKNGGFSCPKALIQAFSQMDAFSKKLNLQENRVVTIFHKIVKQGFNLDFQIEQSNVCEFLGPNDLSKLRSLEGPFLKGFGDEYLVSKINEGVSLRELGFSESSLKEFLEKQGKNIKCLNLEGFPISNTTLNKNLQKLQKLNLSGVKVDYGLALLIAKFKELKHLDLSRSGLSFEGLSIITSEIPGLEKLHLSGNKVEDQSIKELQSLVNLKELNVAGCQITSGGMRLVGQLVNLEKLDISGNKVEDQSIKELQSLVNLKELNVRACDITSEAMSFIGQLSSLERLDISCNKIGNIDVEELNSLINLKELRANRCGITSSGMGFIGQFSNLEKLDISDNSIRNEGMKILQFLVNLKELNVLASDITSEAMSFIGQLSSLERLDISYNRIGNIDAEVLKPLINLKELRVNSCEITSDGMGFVGCLSNLESLAITGNTIGDRDVEVFKSLINLKELFIFNYYPSKSIDELKKSLPHILIKS